MTAEEILALSRRIATRMEPEPTRAETIAIMKRGWSSSPKCRWELARHSGQSPDDIESFYWRPEPIASPQVAMRLLEELLKTGFRLRLTETNEYVFLRINVDGSHNGAAHENLPIAIALAFEKMMDEK